MTQTFAPPSAADEPPPGSAANATALPVGTRLQEFEVTGFIGEGGFSVVYEGYDTSLNRRVAIKEYLPAQLATRAAANKVTVRSARHRDTFEAGLTSFINEARLLAQFKHPALVEVFRFWEENQTAYMAMPYYDGQTLKQFLTVSPQMVDERWLQMMLAPLLDALGHMHSMDVFHRDIAPDNILLLKNGNPLLLDLGAARHIIGDMTQALTVILKPGFAPIEQYSDDPSIRQGPWTDIYALSALLYFAITSKAPAAAVARMIKDPMPKLAQAFAGKGFSTEFLAAIDHGLSVLPENRPQSIDAFREQLGVSTYSMSSPTVRQMGVARTRRVLPEGGDTVVAPKPMPQTQQPASRETANEPPPAGAAGAKPAMPGADRSPPATGAGGSAKKTLIGALTVAALALGATAAVLLKPGSPAPQDHAVAPLSTPAAEPTAPAQAVADQTPNANSAEFAKAPPASVPPSAQPAGNLPSTKAPPAPDKPTTPQVSGGAAAVAKSGQPDSPEALQTTPAQPPVQAPAATTAESPAPPTAAPKSAPAKREWHAALIDELRLCGAANALERLLCAERAKWKYCHPSRWGEVPECPATATTWGRP